MRRYILFRVQAEEIVSPHMQGAVVPKRPRNSAGGADDRSPEPHVISDQPLAFQINLRLRQEEERVKMFQGGALYVQRAARFHLRGELQKALPCRRKIAQPPGLRRTWSRSEEHTSELQS